MNKISKIILLILVIIALIVVVSVEVLSSGWGSFIDSLLYAKLFGLIFLIGIIIFLIISLRKNER